jgi:hypothetical protein
MHSIGIPDALSLPTGRTFNAEYYHENIMVALVSLRLEVG